MFRKLRIPVIASVGALIMAVGLMPQSGSASSHREAPLISLDPAADNTDLYAFVSPDKPDTVTIVANYIPLEEPAGGPNFASFDPSVRYEIHIDNDGDAKEDITYRFTFDTKILNKNTFLYNTGPITSLDDSDYNVRQSYRVTRIDHHGSHTLGSNVPVPPVNIGPRSTSNYGSLASAAVKQLSDGSTVFAGQRDDPFFVDLGSVFDLLGLRPFNPAHVIPLPAAEGVDGVSGYNTHSIVIQVPKTLLTKDGKAADANNGTIGIYASASRQRMRILRDNGTIRNSGSWMQVSRLGEPLINEVIIPLRDKDRWNASDPEDDKQFLDYYRKPEVTVLENALYPVLQDAPTTNRDDLVAVLLTGVPSLNYTGNTKADLLRLNMTIAPTSDPKRLGVLEGDFAGFPNGRRLTDDVADIEVRALACGYGDILAQALNLCNLSPNNAIGDGVDANDKTFMSSFPYLAIPHQGYESPLHPSQNMSRMQ